MKYLAILIICLAFVFTGCDGKKDNDEPTVIQPEIQQVEKVFGLGYDCRDHDSMYACLLNNKDGALMDSEYTLRVYDNATDELLIEQSGVVNQSVIDAYPAAVPPGIVAIFVKRSGGNLHECFYPPEFSLFDPTSDSYPMNDYRNVVDITLADGSRWLTTAYVDEQEWADNREMREDGSYCHPVIPARTECDDVEEPVSNG